MKSNQKAVNAMCPGCALFGNDCPGTTSDVWTGCVYKKPVQHKPICRPKLIYQPDATTEYPYNVQLWHSYDGGHTFWYAGYGRFFRDEESAKEFVRVASRA